MSPRLYISDYYADGTEEDVGESVTFHVQDAVEGLIIQQVRHRVTMHGHTDTNVFYECWNVSKKGRISPANTDSFFIPCSYGKQSGSVDIKCKAWFLPCNAHQARRELSLEDADSSVSGVLPSENGKVPLEYVRPGIKRRWRATWTAGGGKTCLQIDSSRSYG